MVRLRQRNWIYHFKIHHIVESLSWKCCSPFCEFIDNTERTLEHSHTKKHMWRSKLPKHFLNTSPSSSIEHWKLRGFTLRIEEPCISPSILVWLCHLLGLGYSDHIHFFFSSGWMLVVSQVFWFVPPPPVFNEVICWKLFAEWKDFFSVQMDYAYWRLEI